MGWGEYVAIGLFVAGSFGTWVRSLKKEIELLKTKNETQREIIADLKGQNLKLEVTGIAVNRLISQLPSSDPTPREIKP